MKLLLFIRSLDLGGSERQITHLARGLARHGHDVSLALLYSGGPFESFLRDVGVTIISVEKTDRWNIIGPLLRLRQLFIKGGFDAVYAFLPTQCALSAALMPFRSQSKLIFGLRASNMDMTKYDALSSFAYRAETFLSLRANLIIANAEAVCVNAIRRGLPKDRIAIIPNGIDTEIMRPNPKAGSVWRRSYGIDDKDFVVGMVARLDPMKDHKTFLAAAEIFLHQYQDARFVCVGDGPAAYLNELKSVANLKGVAGRLIWTGAIRNVQSAYNAFDIATLSSAFGEGFSNVVGEAMACGVPVVATDVGDNQTVIDVYGQVVPPRRPDLLAAAWGLLRHRSSNDLTLSNGAREHIVTKYSLDMMTRRTERAIAALCAGEQPASIVKECQFS